MRAGAPCQRCGGQMLVYQDGDCACLACGFSDYRDAHLLLGAPASASLPTPSDPDPLVADRRGSYRRAEARS